jgi:hypothetical protein
VREYSVRLVLSDGYFVDRAFVYRGDSPPKPNQVIVVESKRVPAEPSCLALVTRVKKNDDGLLIQATEQR